MIQNIAVIFVEAQLQTRAKALAKTYHLVCRSQISQQDEIGLYVYADYLSLKQNNPQAGEVFVDFVTGKQAHRRLYGGGRNQALARAMGFNKKAKPIIFDATAGWGRDAWVLASLGATVYLCEQQPLLGLLLADGLQRAAACIDVVDITKRLHLTVDNSIHWLQTENNKFLDTIYLDPMYPKRQKSAAVKKDMQLLQALYKGHANLVQHNDLLLKTALAHPCHRVVVKRPLKADFLAKQKPQAQIKSKQTRYDIYLT